MLLPTLRVFLALAVVYLPSTAVFAFQPGADYGLYKTTNLYNCSGTVLTSNVTARNSVDTLPQIEPLSDAGWEQWDFFMHGTFPIIMRWYQGDQSDCSSTPSVGKIDVAILDVNGTNVQTTLVGPLTYKNDAGVKAISIGDNTFHWDNSTQWYNLTLNVDGYSLVLNTYSAMLDTFHPNVGYYDGRLSSVGDPALYGSVPITRGQSGGYLLTPDKQNITLDGLTTLKHMFSEKALPGYISGYSSAIVWGYSTGFYDTHVFIEIDESNGTVHQAAYIGRAIQSPTVKTTFSSTYAIYAVTDDTALYHLTINQGLQTINSTFPGCSAVNNMSYAFNLTLAGVLGEFTDLGGGKTTYYTLNGTTSAPFGGKLVSAPISGAFEVYQAPTTSK
ncbi:hypothetical protein SCLCIDRAFT_1222250 [Scleroderma citrinum Foug A]|uniref:Uncharacterized protein n=1 Tax=Scleroderma citrinum Foug A TaxID=1036808 RepID=A0A0C3D076_9AGAM|nr:hypothetical protein SCLCIDRAFT_1222250 [Scleroderma citrinum Foug A]